DAAARRVQEWKTLACAQGAQANSILFHLFLGVPCAFARLILLSAAPPRALLLRKRAPSLGPRGMLCDSTRSSSNMNTRTPHARSPMPMTRRLAILNAFA